MLVPGRVIVKLNIKQHLKAPLPLVISIENKFELFMLPIPILPKQYWGSSIICILVGGFNLETTIYVYQVIFPQIWVSPTIEESILPPLAARHPIAHCFGGVLV